MDLTNMRLNGVTSLVCSARSATTKPPALLFKPFHHAADLRRLPYSAAGRGWNAALVERHRDAVPRRYPAALRNRAADNWRVLLSIADDLGHGEAARSAAVALCANRPDEDPGVVLLAEIRTVFQARGVDRIASLALIEALLGLEDNFWNEWRGPHDDRPPRKLTQGELSRLLRPFGIGPKTIWPARRRLGDKSSRGYLRSQFEQAWHATPRRSAL